MNKKIFLIIFGIFLISSAFALSASPARTIFEFKAGSTENGVFSLTNNEDYDINAKLEVQGELAEYVELHDRNFDLGAKESKIVNYKINIPDALLPGMHSAKIRILQNTGSIMGETLVAASVGVEIEIVIFVPYPDKYAEASLNIEGPDSNGIISCVIPIINRGSIRIEGVNAVVYIKNALGDVIANLTSKEISIAPQERGELVMTWDANNKQFGSYKAIANLFYDDNSLMLEKEFEIGEQIIELESIEVRNFKLGGIAKFEIGIKNTWGKPVNNFNAQMIISTREGGVVGNIKTISYDLPALSTTKINAFWDSSKVQKGTYDAVLLLNRDNKAIQRNFQLDVSDDRIDITAIGFVITARESTNLNRAILIVLIALIVLLALANIVWFLVLRKRVKNARQRN